MLKRDLQKLAQRLCELGEDKDELNLWVSIYDDLEPDEQTELEANLQNELTKLESVNELNGK